MIPIKLIYINLFSMPNHNVRTAHFSFSLVKSWLSLDHFCLGLSLLRQISIDIFFIMFLLPNWFGNRFSLLVFLMLSLIDNFTSYRIEKLSIHISDAIVQVLFIWRDIIINLSWFQQASEARLLDYHLIRNYLLISYATHLLLRCLLLDCLVFYFLLDFRGLYCY